jgi:DNA-binding LacI/PurR family transcriptional regulator
MTRSDRPRQVGIRDVARLAGVSAATVSRVLNGSETVAEDLRRRVFDAAQEAGYRPNRLARNLRRQKTDMIGVIVSDIANPHYSEAVRFMEDEAFRAGYRVMLCNSDERVDKQRLYLRLLADERVRAVILSPADEAGTGTEPLLDLDIPVLAFDRVIDDPRVDAVSCNNVEGVRRLTEHFIWLGHTRIAFVGGSSHVATGPSRLAGYLEAVRGSGLVPFTVEGAFRSDTAEAAVRGLLKDGVRPTAMVVANNAMVVGALRAIRDAGVEIPGDLALGTVDDPVWAELANPPLTTLAQPVRAMAEAAVRMILERVEGGRREARHVDLPMELRVRRSSGGPIGAALQATAPASGEGAAGTIAADA